MLSAGKVILIAAILAVVHAYEEDEGYGYNSAEDVKEEVAKPYHFGYEIEDHNGKQHRHEHSDGEGTVKGSYGFVDDHGVHREVHYVADDFGFRAQVITNEKGTDNKNPADVHVHSLYEDDHLYSPHKDAYIQDGGHH